MNPLRSAASSFSKHLLMLGMTVSLVSIMETVWAQPDPQQASRQDDRTRLLVESGYLTGSYQGTVEQVMDSLGHSLSLTYAAPTDVSGVVVSGVLEQVAVDDALRQMFADLNFVLDYDVESGAISVRFLVSQPGYYTVKRSVTGASPEMLASHDAQQTQDSSDAFSVDLPQEQPVQFEASDQEANLTPEQLAQFEAVYQEPDLTPEQQEQFAAVHLDVDPTPEQQALFDVAFEEPLLTPEQQAKFDVANQEAVLSPEQQDQFDVAYQETELPPELQAQFDVAFQKTEQPPELQKQVANAPQQKIR